MCRRFDTPERSLGLGHLGTFFPSVTNPLEPNQLTSRKEVMPRIARSAAAGVVYHVIVRGCGRASLVHDDGDRRFFLERSREVFQDSAVRLLAYCLMDNHFHLVLRADEGGLSRALQRVLTAYAVYFNAKYDHAGHVFQNRFFSKPCRSERYLMVLARYVHLNPVLGGLVRAPEEWAWSSHREFLGFCRAGYSDPGPVLALFGDSSQEFAAFVSGADPAALPLPGGFLPDEEQLPKPDLEPQLNPVLGEIVQELRLRLTVLTDRSRRPDVVAQRRKFIVEAAARGVRVGEIARFLRLGRTAVSMTLLRAAATRESDQLKERP